jgi:hypothetical protein
MTTMQTVAATDTYLAQAKRLMTEAEQDAVTNAIALNPTGGVIVVGTGGLRKMRIPLAGRGKRGGGRVVYWFHSPDVPIMLLLVFAKNAADDMSAIQRKHLTTLAETLLHSFGVKR